MSGEWLEENEKMAAMLSKATGEGETKGLREDGMYS